MPFEYRIICKPDNFWPFEYRTSPVFRWLLYKQIFWTKLYKPGLDVDEPLLNLIHSLLAIRDLPNNLKQIDKLEFVHVKGCVPR